ncbi:hypothetical protein CDAR_259101 [Caerostris darwini]|uniref:Uncharacterized protein n=1 Tax=Caerostris darwini TaxID=1538125 RepID=A0AAV4PQ47_9ARAC|nr:hypothetical protein CDAR_259101 [Caerostris darwini]
MKNKRSLESPDVDREMPSNLENFKKDENAPSNKMKLSFREIFKEENSANATENIFLPSAETNLSMDNAGASGAIGSCDDLLPAISAEQPVDDQRTRTKNLEEVKREWNIFIQDLYHIDTSDSEECELHYSPVESDGDGENDP